MRESPYDIRAKKRKIGEIFVDPMNGCDIEVVEGKMGSCYGCVYDNSFDCHGSVKWRICGNSEDYSNRYVLYIKKGLKNEIKF